MMISDVPPNDEQLEKHVLGSCTVAMDVNPELTADLFYYDRNKAVLKALQDGHYMPDVITAEKYGIQLDYFFEILESSGSSIIKDESINILRELSARRSLIAVSRDNLRKAHDLTLDAKELDVDLTSGSEIVSSEELAVSVAKDWAKSKKIRTGFKLLDNAVSGFDISDVWILAGRSGTKKTSLGMQVLNNICSNENCKGIFFSIEMGKNQLFKRLGMLHYYEHLDVQWQTGDYVIAKEHARQWFDQNKNIDLARYLAPKTYSICWKTGLTVAEIASYIRIERKAGKKINVILIDYLQLMKDPESRDRRDEVSRIARDLKALAKKELVKVICLSQLSRASEDGSIEPKLHHLKESGDIEEAADIITGSWKGADDSHTNIVPLKNRNDGTDGKFFLMTDGVTFRTPRPDETAMLMQ